MFRKKITFHVFLQECSLTFYMPHIFNFQFGEWFSWR